MTDRITDDELTALLGMLDVPNVDAYSLPFTDVRRITGQLIAERAEVKRLRKRLTNKTSAKNQRIDILVAELERTEAERDELRAEVERLKGIWKAVDSSVEGWDARRLVREILKMPHFRRMTLGRELAKPEFAELRAEVAGLKRLAEQEAENADMATRKAAQLRAEVERLRRAFLPTCEACGEPIEHEGIHDFALDRHWHAHCETLMDQDDE